MSPTTAALILGLIWGAFLMLLGLWAWRNWQQATDEEVADRAWEEWAAMEADLDDMPAEEWV